MGATWSIAQLKGYHDSWAATQAYEVFPGLVPGFALHDELQAMAAAGDRGTVETGKPADLLLPSADPLGSVSQHAWDCCRHCRRTLRVPTASNAVIATGSA
jgi:cytosine/adenosine deaminase-related metal-dependent hydrolase